MEETVINEKQSPGKKSSEISGISRPGDETPTPVEGAQVACYAVDKNGIKLHPQPTSDPLDPLNWSNFQKHTILSAVMLK